MMNINELIKRVQEETKVGLPFMEGREKAEIGMGEVLTIDNYGYLDGNDGEFVVFTVKEYGKSFFFGSSVLTSKMKDLDASLGEDNMDELLKHGIEIVFEKKMSKNKRTYTNCTFFPNQK